MQKLDVFKGRVDFNKDSPAKINKVLNSLQEYLDKYEEPDASELIEQLKSQDKTQKDRIEAKQFRKLYTRRTKVLEDLGRTFRRIHDDLIDEQDTSIKKKPKRLVSKVSSKIKDASTKVSGQVKDQGSKIKDFFSSLLRKLIGLKHLPYLLLAGLAGFVIANIKKIGGFLLSSAWKGVKFVGKLILRGAAWIGKTLAKVTFRIVTKVIGAAGRLLKNLGKVVVKAVSKGLRRIGTLLSKVWRAISLMASGIKNKATKAIKKAASAASKGAKSLKSKLGRGKQFAAGRGKSLVQKSKLAIEAVKSKVLPGLRASGKSTVAKAVSKSLGKLATRAVPFLGWGLLAYEAYEAAKESNSLTSFGINLLDNVSGGLISLAVKDTNGESLGNYIEGLMLNDRLDQIDDLAGVGADMNSAGSNSSSSSSSLSSNNMVDQASKETFNSINNINNKNYFNSKTSYTTGDSINGVNNSISKNSQYSNNSNINVNNFDRSGNLIQLSHIKKNVSINNHNQEYLQNVKDQAVYEAVSISEKMNSNTFGATRSLIQNNIQNNNSTVVVNKNTAPLLSPPVITQG